MPISNTIPNNFEGFHPGEENKDFSLGVPLELLKGKYRPLCNNARLLYSFLLFKKATDREENFFD